MNKGINKSRIVACMLAAGFLAVGSGCTDSDFDLSNIDQTIGIGGDGLQLPTNSTENIVLDDLLDLNNSDFISIAVRLPNSSIVATCPTKSVSLSLQRQRLTSTST